MAQRRQRASPKIRSRPPRQTVESLRQALSRERVLRKQGLAREKEALERQTASAEILQIISRSSTDAQPVLDAVAASAARLCGAIDAIVMRVDGNEMRRAATSESRPQRCPAKRDFMTP